MYNFYFKCQNCSEEFNVQFKYMLKKESVVYPNCSNTLPEEAFKYIKAVATSLEEYGKAEMRGDSKFKHFNFSIQKLEYCAFYHLRYPKYVQPAHMTRLFAEEVRLFLLQKGVRHFR